MTERNHAFDLLCGVCILRMLLNHVTSFCGFGGTEWWRALFFWTFYFISFFFFKAGYFNKTTHGDTREYLRRKARQLLVPYVSWGLIGCAVYFGMMYFATLRYGHAIEPIRWEHLWRTGGTYGNMPLWFLLSFFVSYVGMHLLGKLRRLHWVVALFPLASYGLYAAGNPLWWSLNNVFMGIYLFMLGHYWHVLIDRLPRRAVLLLSVGLVAFFVAGNVLLHGEYVASENQWTGNPVVVTVNLSAALCGLSGLLIATRVPRVPLVSFIGQHSMVYFVAHYPMIVFYRFVRIAFGRSIVGRWEDWIVLLIVVPIICSWLVPYVERVPWLSGRFARCKPGGGEVHGKDSRPELQEIGKK